MSKEDIIDFFDGLASQWDADMIRNDSVINEILDYADITQGKMVLDVACGTGVLFPYYMKRNVKKITGVDISKKMIEIAKTKFKDSDIELINSDIEEVSLINKYDCCMVYNAFPHFFNRKKLLECLAEKIIRGGRLTIAHGMSREKVNRHHSGSASKVSMKLMSANELAELFKPLFDVDVIVSDKMKYVVSGIKR